jgi:hypothetical protein
MRISSGLAEINYNSPQTNRIVSEKIFTWPVYNAGKIEKIHGVTRHTESNITYSKPSVEDRIKLLSMSDSNAEMTYTQAGEHRSSRAVAPGSLFDAIV